MVCVFRGSDLRVIVNVNIDRYKKQKKRRTKKTEMAAGGGGVAILDSTGGMSHVELKEYNPEGARAHVR